MSSLNKLFVLILPFALAACSSTREWNPFVDRATQFTLHQTTQLFGPDASRTGRESIDWLQRQIARQAANKL